MSAYMFNVKIYVIQSLVPTVSNNNSLPVITSWRSQNGKNRNNKITI